jgi:L-fuconolactonase
MLIVDSQVHIWPPDRPDRPLLHDGGENSPYRYEQLLADMDRAGVDRAILVPPSIEGDRNDYALEAAQKHPGRFAVMGRFSLQSARDKNLLARWREQPGMLGVRLTFHRDADRPWLTDGTADWFWPEAERHAIPVMVHAPERLAEIGTIAARHPSLTLIIDHMGFARATIDAETKPAAARICALARYPQRVRESFGAALLLDGALPVPKSARGARAYHQGVRPAPRVLGQRYHPRAKTCRLPAGGDSLH